MLIPLCIKLGHFNLYNVTRNPRKIIRFNFSNPDHECPWKRGHHWPVDISMTGSTSHHSYHNRTTYPTAIFLYSDIPCVFCAAENIAIRTEELYTFVVILLFCIIPVKHTILGWRPLWSNKLPLNNTFIFAKQFLIKQQFYLFRYDGMEFSWLMSFFKKDTVCSEYFGIQLQWQCIGKGSTTPIGIWRHPVRQLAHRAGSRLFRRPTAAVSCPRWRLYRCVRGTGVFLLATEVLCSIAYQAAELTHE